MLILNIGIESRHDNKALKTWQESMRLASMYEEFSGMGKIALQHSVTEPTVVITMEQTVLDYLYMCGKFQQDAIAVYNTTIQLGYVHTLDRQKVPFLREFFVLPCGRRLSEVPYL